MKYIVGILVLAFFAHSHFKDDTSSKSGKDVELPSWFTPETWSPELRAENLKKIREVAEATDYFINNPPT